MQDASAVAEVFAVQRLIDMLEQQAANTGLSPELVQRLRQEVEKRQRTEQALRESEARLQAIFDAAVDGIVTIDERGIIESVNPATERIFGYSAAEMLGRNVSLLMPSPYREQHDDYLRNYFRTGVKKIIGIGREAVGQRKDGTVFPVDLAVNEVQTGERRLFVGLVRDITQRKAVEAELRAARDAAEAASRAKDQFLAVLSHELRNPLTPVLMSAGMLERSPDLPPDLREDVEVIRRNIAMESRLIDDLLDLTRITRGKIQLHFEVVDAHACVKHALDICQSDIDAKGIAVCIALRARECHVWADPARLQQVLWNLLTNAVKFTPEDGALEIRTSNDAAGRLRFEITDSGIGIDPEALPRIFNAFEQAESTTARRFGGLGLGLAIAKMLVDMHQGALSAFSEGKDKGATFTLELSTIATQPAEPAPSASAPVRLVSNDPPQSSLRILLVEDHADTRLVVARQLQTLGHRVRTAASVTEALQMAAAEPFDLLISDLGLPDGSGLDIIRQVKQRHNLRGIAVSGFGMEEDMAKSRAAGFEHHLTKPVDFQRLREVIQSLAS